MTTASFTIQADDSSQIETIKNILKALKVKFEFNTTDKPYNPEFVAKIKKGQQDYKDRKGTILSLEDIDQLCK